MKQNYYLMVGLLAASYPFSTMGQGAADRSGANPPVGSFDPALLKKLQAEAQPKAEASKGQAESGTLPTGGESFSVLDREIGISGDYLYGLGNIQVPLGYGLANGGQDAFGNGRFTSANRNNASYYGGTLSGSLGKTWYLDASYSRGVSEASIENLDAIYAPNTLPITITPRSTFTLTQEFYQLYLKYAFPQLSGTRTSAYLRVGATFTDSKLLGEYYSVDSTGERFGDFGTYNSKTKSYLGNLGFGIEYAIVRGDRFRFSAMIEGEGFGGGSQINGSENFATPGQTLDQGYAGSFNVSAPTYGALGRGVARFSFILDGDGRFRLNLDVGAQANYSIVEFSSMPDGQKSPNSTRQNVRGEELLWGPYSRLGFSYSF